MTGRDMTDEQVRAELERIDPELAKCFDRTKIKYLPGVMYITAYRLLAESQRALGEIAKREPMKYRYKDKGFRYCGGCGEMISIAATHRKGGSNG